MEIEIKVYCAVCGAELSGVLRTNRYDTTTIDVDPCQDCLSEEYDTGYEDGKVEG